MTNHGQRAENTRKRHSITGGKNRRFYASAAAMLALILAPFGLYAALAQGYQPLAGLFFALIAGSMLLIVLIS